MSYDPCTPGSYSPPEYSSSVPSPKDIEYAQRRVQMPAIGLIVLGILNLLLAGILAFYGFGVSRIPLDQLEQMMQQQNAEALEELKSQGWDIADIRNMLIYGSFSWAGMNVLTALLVMVGSIRMLSLKSYGLAILASLWTALPCVSCSGCCGLGLIVGIWALIVLLDAQVRAAFQ